MKKLHVKKTPYENKTSASMSCANCGAGSCNGGGGGGCHIRILKK